MPLPPEAEDKARALRAQGVQALRAGRVQKARAAFLQSLRYDPEQAVTFLWLAGLAATEEEARRLLDHARRLNPDHPQLAHVARGIDQQFALAGRVFPSSGHPPTAETLRPDEDIAEPSMVPLRSGRSWGCLGVIASAGWRLVTIVVLIITLVFVIALLMDLARAGGVGHFGDSLSAAGEYTLQFLQGAAHGDLGSMTATLNSNRNQPVTEHLARALPKSLGLLAVSLVLALALGLYLGMAAALRRHGPLSGVLLFASTLGISTPAYFAAMLLIWFSLWLYKSTGQHILPVAGFGWDGHLLLPSLVLAARPAAVVTRLGYNALIEILDADYVRTARSKGLRQSVILVRHVLRNAGVPILTTAVVSLRFSLAVLPIVEYIFNWPGIGLMLLKAIQAQDTAGVIGMILPVALILALMNLLAEQLYPRIDPRLRPSGVAAV